MLTRLLDILVAAAVLLILAPLLVFIALLVVLDSPGNPLYRARRVGRKGRVFQMWKFRTMVKDADRLGGPITGRCDPRVTRWGALLRRTKLDELPQFVNVLAGDMTLVGPRPEAPELVARYTPEQRAVLEVKPGLTGYVQLACARESDEIPSGVAAEEYYARHVMQQKLERDLQYLRRRTLWGDAKILLDTAVLVLRAFAGK